MKALTLIQPWATLIALGEKKIETRSWSTKYTGEIAIHAGKKIDKNICTQEPFKSILKAYGFSVNNLPTGCIIAKCELIACLRIKTEDVLNEMAFLDGGDKWVVAEGNEYHFGDYTPNRYGWLLRKVKMLEEPIPAKGTLGLWE
ncbi:ASCH domain-containing protein [Petroclostridium sp. X23]|uniref:ASCH domain-containing protein n=1 Tax=Petroclostridium sp. X23 TaxID=3045146 RepID=UPI0024ADD9F8|nr:ASCH domain-containing protein [Petroclostridium sp. X23]WHH58294.1 ASCH domain-containing protein [Petroclostridium sp. X23]